MMKIDTNTLIGIVFFAIAATLFMSGVALRGLGEYVEAPSSSDQSQEDIDRARFMIECRYEWMLSQQECEATLRGEALPDMIDGC